MSERTGSAKELFQEGFNCCQSVFLAYAGLFGMDRETALKLTSGMGAGIGRMREVCGTVSAMSLLAGLKAGNADPGDRENKAAVYELVRAMSNEFRERNGSIICRELLGIRGMEKSAAPSLRTEQYYKTRPCLKVVEAACEIIEEHLL